MLDFNRTLSTQAQVTDSPNPSTEGTSEHRCGAIASDEALQIQQLREELEATKAKLQQAAATSKERDSLITGIIECRGRQESSRQESDRQIATLRDQLRAQRAKCRDKEAELEQLEAKVDDLLLAKGRLKKNSNVQMKERLKCSKTWTRCRKRLQSSAVRSGSSKGSKAIKIEHGLHRSTLPASMYVGVLVRMRAKTKKNMAAAPLASLSTRCTLSIHTVTYLDFVSIWLVYRLPPLHAGRCTLAAAPLASTWMGTRL